MFITKEHFLSPFARIIKNGKVQEMLQSIDTDLMVATRIVGIDEQNNYIIDLVKIDSICFIADGMPSYLQDMITNFKIYNTEAEFKKEHPES